MSIESGKYDDSNDIHYGALKTEIFVRKAGDYELCEVCKNNIDSETRDCCFQQLYGANIASIRGEDMTQDVRPSSFCRTTEVTVCENGGIYKQASPATLQRNTNLSRKNGSKRTNSGSLRRHERIHISERPFQCKICFKAFGRSNHLKVHERIHTGERAVRCKFCSKTFAQPCNLTRHERIHTGEKPFHCTICLDNFIDSRSLKVHKRFHKGEYRFECKICSKAFDTLSHMKVHEKIHTEEKPFQCKICSKTFTWLSILRIHERIHTG